jgi:hypothetical protein
LQKTLTVLLQLGGGSPAARSSATFVAVQGKEALQLVWRAFGKVHCGEHFGADLPDPNQVQERCGCLIAVTHNLIR